jgi:type IV secretion system protein VirB3
VSRNQGILTADPLFVAITRPTMKFGVTYSALLFNGVLTMEVVTFTQNILWMLMFVPLHGVFALLCLYEPRFFDLLLAWAQTARASSYRPYRVDLPDGRGRRRHRNIEVVL